MSGDILGPPRANSLMADRPLDPRVFLCSLMEQERIAVAFLKLIEGLKKKMEIIHAGRFSHRGTVQCLSSQDIKLSNFHQITHFLVHVNVPTNR